MYSFSILILLVPLEKKLNEDDPLFCFEMRINNP